MNQNIGNTINLYAYGGLGWAILYELKKLSNRLIPKLKKNCNLTRIRFGGLDADHACGLRLALQQIKASLKPNHEQPVLRPKKPIS